MTIVSMSPVRFATAQSLFETFPELSLKISARPSEQFPIEFLQTLVATGKVEDAVTFCSYLLPRREAVWWACGCVRTLLRNIAEERAAAANISSLRHKVAEMRYTEKGTQGSTTGSVATARAKLAAS